MTVEQRCTIVEAVHLPSGGVSMTFQSHGMAAQITRPGQFVHVRCGEGLLLRRPISICSWSVEGASDSMSLWTLRAAVAMTINAVSYDSCNQYGRHSAYVTVKLEKE